MSLSIIFVFILLLSHSSNMENKTLSMWVGTYTNELFNWAYYKVSDADLAKDLVQDTFLAAAEKTDSFKAESSPKTWLFSILNHKIIDYYRKKVNQPLSIENQTFLNFFDADGSWRPDKSPKDWGDDDKHLLDDDDFQNILTKCLDALPEKWSTSVKLKYLLDKNTEDICQELKIAPTNLWQIMHRAKLQLRDCVENNWFKK
jgi:RNA polymerase sigma-70 factor (ECF subfamily)